MFELIAWPSVYHWIAPPRSVAVAKVVTNEFIPSRVTAMPLAVPTSRPTTKAATTHTASGESCFDINPAAVTDDAAAMAPREKSKCPAIRGTMAASASRRVTDWLATRICRFALEGKTSLVDGSTQKNSVTASSRPTSA